MLVALDKFDGVVIPSLMLTMSGVLSTACLSAFLSLNAVTIHLRFLSSQTNFINALSEMGVREFKLQFFIIY